MKSNKKTFGKFILLWLGQFISTIGSGLTSFGLGIYVFEKTGKVSAMAFIMLLAFLPSLLLGIGAGILADRYDRRLLMILGDSLSATGLVFILICMFNGGAQFWQICVGVTISSIFSSLLQPSYKATVTDLLTEEQYTKASGLVQVADSAKFLISPVVAGFLLSVSDIKLLLIIDICTFFVTVISTFTVKKGLVSKTRKKTKSFISEFKDGWKAVHNNRGVFLLVISMSVLTFFIGFIQTLATPLILAFSNSSTLGTIETISASGMLVTSMILGLISIKKGYIKILTSSLFGAGIFMMMFGFRENIIAICISGFLFFAMLPFANTSVDFLIRTNIENSLQGRAWGLIGVISQLGYVLSYALSGILADYIFTPLLLEKGILADSIGIIIGTGIGRGTGFLIIISGLFLSLTSIILYNVKSIRKLELRDDICKCILEQ